MNPNQHLEQMQRIVGEVFEIMLHTTVSPANGSDLGKGPGVKASVDYVGQWQGTLDVQCGDATAANICRALYPGTDPVEYNEEVRDAMCEVANIIGGNMKCALPVGVRLSLPCASREALGAQAGSNTAALFMTGPIGDFQVRLTLP